MNTKEYRTAKRHTLESERSNALFKRLERALLRVERGNNLFQPEVFCDLARYYLEDEDERADALASGRFAVGDIVFLRVRDLPEWKPAKELAASAGVTLRHMSRLLKNANVPFRLEGCKKLYDYGYVKSRRLVSWT